MAYVYLDHEERVQPKPIHALASLLKQPVSRLSDIPLELENLHMGLEGEGKSPSFKELYITLVATFKSFCL